MRVRRYAPVVAAVASLVAVTSGVIEAAAVDPNPLVEVARYNNPLRQISHLIPKQIDQGVDYFGSGYIYPIGEGKVDFVCTVSCGWPGLGTFIAYHMTKGPAASSSYHVFIAECLTPKPGLAAGNDIDPNHYIATLNNMGSCASIGMETGWADPAAWKQTMAKRYGQGDDPKKTTYFGENFNRLMISLGAPSGLQSLSGHSGCGTLSSALGCLPAAWAVAKGGPCGTKTGMVGPELLTTRTVVHNYLSLLGVYQYIVFQLQRYTAPGSQWCLQEHVAISFSDGSSPPTATYNINVRFFCNGSTTPLGVGWGFDFAGSHSSMSTSTPWRTASSCSSYRVDNADGSYGSQVVDDFGTKFNYNLPTATERTYTAYAA
jgi:hypothetical protein